MKYIISGVIGFTVGYFLKIMGMDIRLILGISFCMGILIGRNKKWKYQ